MTAISQQVIPITAYGRQLVAESDAPSARNRLGASGGLWPVALGGTGASDPSGARSNLGLGSIATQNASAVAITGGSISGITDLAIADGGTGASTAANARTNLGLGSIATQNANAVTITGGSLVNLTGVAISPASGEPGFVLNANAGITRPIAWTTAGTLRWKLAANNTAESGNNAGSDFSLFSYTDAGAFLGEPLRITRSTGAALFSGNVSVVGAAIIGGTLTVSGAVTFATKLAVDQGGTGASTAANARTNLGLGSIATQNANSVGISGGTITGIGTFTVVSTTEPTATISGSPAHSKLLAFASNGSPRWRIGGTSTAESGDNSGSDFAIYRYADNGAFLSSAVTINRATGAANFNGSLAASSLTINGNANLHGDASNVLSLRNGTSAQSLRIYNTYTDASNYELLSFAWAGNVAFIQTGRAGTGSLRDMAIYAAGNLHLGSANTARFLINGTTGHLVATNDNTNDFGTSGGSRPRSIYAGTSIVSPIFGFASSRGTIQAPSDGVFKLLNNAGSGFGMLQFGGETNSFAAIKASATTLQVRTANDDDFATLQGKLQTDANAEEETIEPTHTLTIYDAAGLAYKVPCVAAS